MNPKFPVIYYGGDYNPDQWPEETRKEDMRLFQKAYVNMVTLPVFSWAKLQPAENEYRFEWLDKIFDMLEESGISVCLATSTAAQPAWMSLKYPEILPVDMDGRKRKQGGRVNFCPNSKIYRDFSVKLAGKMAERYKNRKSLKVWHIGNEYGTYCFCDNCAAAFREWLKKRYGTIDDLNRRWNMSFWGHTVYDWEEVVPPTYLNEIWKDNTGQRDSFCFQGMSLDYSRFMSDSSLECYSGEYRAIKAVTPDIPVTTNLMGTFKPLDYFRWAEKMDVVSWDSYPAANDPVYKTAFRHDLMRGLKNGQSFMLMEQTPSQQNWAPYNTLKRPGVMRLWSYQALARGSDTVMFFQLRRSIGACEKYHGALIEHAGHENTRVFRECTVLGEELERLAGIFNGSALKADAAIIFDWENWWAVEFSSGPSRDLKYVDQVEKYYEALYHKNIAVDIIRPDSDLSGYKIVIAPLLYMIKPGVAENLEKFVKNGGTFVTGFFSGYVNENDLVTTGGYPGELRKILGIWVEEIDALIPGTSNSIIMKKKFGGLSSKYSCSLLCDLLHTEGAETLAVYGDDFYKEMPVLTVNTYGSGKAYYVASDPAKDFIRDFTGEICREKGIVPVLEAPENVEVTKRSLDGKDFIFILNHNREAVTVKIPEGNWAELISGKKAVQNTVLPPNGVIILSNG